MPKAEWGTKHTCKGCDAKFYDMLQTLPACPVCRAIVGLETKAVIELVKDDVEPGDDVLVDVVAGAALETEDNDGDDDAPCDGQRIRSCVPDQVSIGLRRPIPGRGP